MATRKKPAKRRLGLRAKPADQATLREERIDHVAGMLAEEPWLTRGDRRRLASEWRVTLAEVGDIIRAATRRFEDPAVVDARADVVEKLRAIAEAAMSVGKFKEAIAALREAAVIGGLKAGGREILPVSVPEPVPEADAPPGEDPLEASLAELGKLLH